MAPRYVTPNPPPAEWRGAPLARGFMSTALHAESILVKNIVIYIVWLWLEPLTPRHLKVRNGN